MYSVNGKRNNLGQSFWDTFTSAVKSGVQAVGQATGSTPAFQSAVNVVKGKVGEFFQLPGRIDAAMKKANILLSQAQAKGKNLEAGEVSGLISFLNSLKSKYTSTESKLKSVLDSLKVAGLGVIPLVLVTAVIAVAASVTYLIKSIYATERALDAVEKKILSPEEANKLFGGFGLNLGGITTPLILIAVVGIGLMAFKGRGK